MEGATTPRRILSEDEICRVRQLRKEDPARAAKLYRRLKSRHNKQSKDQRRSTAVTTSQFYDENEEEPLGLLTENDTEDYTLDDALEDAPADVAAEMREVYERFNYLDETRAAGKGGAGEEFLEFNESGRAAAAAEERKKKKEAMEDDDDDEELEQANRNGLSKKKIKQLRRPTISYLKQICSRPEVVEAWDTTAPDPELLVFLKAYRNTVVVPGHWSHKRRYLQGKRGIERSQFALPHYIEATRISEIRSAIEEKDAKKTLKQRMREKSRPRHRKMNIDYQTLHDAFFKYATKPSFTRFGDVYFEGKETEMHFRRYVPGKLSERCRDALGMTSALDAPPWLLNMQRYGPPPSYPNLVVPGVNAHIPEGAALGFQPGGWGKPPTLDQLKIWGVTPRFEEVVLGEDDVEGLEGGGELALWGALQDIESEEEQDVDDDEQAGKEGEAEDEELEASAASALNGGTVTPNILNPAGLAPATLASGMQSTEGGFGLETPQSVDLRRTDFLADSVPKPYTLLEQTKAPTQPSALFASEMIYVLPGDQRSDAHLQGSSLGGATTPLS